MKNISGLSSMFMSYDVVVLLVLVVVHSTVQYECESRGMCLHLWASRSAHTRMFYFLLFTFLIFWKYVDMKFLRFSLLLSIVSDEVLRSYGSSLKSFPTKRDVDVEQRLCMCVCVLWTRRKIHNIDRLFPLNVACMCAYYAPPNCLCCHYMLCLRCDIRCGTWTNKKFIVHYRTSRCCRQSQWRRQHINYLLYATRNMVHRSVQRKRDVPCSTTLCHGDTRQTSLPIYRSIDRNVASIAKKTHCAQVVKRFGLRRTIWI